MAHLAGADQVVEGAHHLFRRRHLIPGMQQVKIDVVGAEALERALHRAQHVLALVAAAVRIGPAAGGGIVESELGGDDHAVARGGLADELAEHALAVAAGVAVGGVEEIAAGFEVAVENRPRLFFFRTPAPVSAEGHGAQGQAGYAQAAAAQGVVVIDGHRVAPC